MHGFWSFILKRNYDAIIISILVKRDSDLTLFPTRVRGRTLYFYISTICRASCSRFFVASPIAILIKFFIEIWNLRICLSISVEKKWRLLILGWLGHLVFLPGHILTMYLHFHYIWPVFSSLDKVIDGFFLINLIKY